MSVMDIHDHLLPPPQKKKLHKTSRFLFNNALELVFDVTITVLYGYSSGAEANAYSCFAVNVNWRSNESIICKRTTHNFRLKVRKIENVPENIDAIILLKEREPTFLRARQVVFRSTEGPFSPPGIPFRPLNGPLRLTERVFRTTGMYPPRPTD